MDDPGPRSGTKPVIGISCCTKLFGEYATPNHSASDTYVKATDQVVGAVPLLIPANGAAADIGAVLARVDGLMLTGSPSNVDPTLYDAPAHPENVKQDTARDAVTTALIRAAVARRMPVLGICRGLQEMNVAFGGSLHQRVLDLPARLDHSAPRHPEFGIRVGNRHEVSLTGQIRAIAGEDRIIVNSLHHQAIDRLGNGVVIEGLAPDGTIEAIRVATSGFALGVQWHPEYDFDSNPISQAIFRAFGRALLAHIAAQADRPHAPR